MVVPMIKLLSFLLLLPCAAHAQLADPTRPPEAWQSSGAATGDGAADSGPRLQSVLLPERGRPVAVISGKTVALGEKFGEARLVSLNEQVAILRGPEGMTQLYLTPEVDKKTMDKPLGGSAGKTGRKKELP